MNPIRARIFVYGSVQGVGFRPFVYRLATSMKLQGRVLNSMEGVTIEAEGPRVILDDFILRLQKEQPVNASIQSLEFSFVDPAGYSGFEICESKAEGKVVSFVLPDISTCSECLQEIFDPANRRYLYPFTNCTNCGPRFTIIESLPYDRCNTAMKAFEMCDVCRREYDDPQDRRFHAQPNACPECGPHMELWNQDGSVFASEEASITQAAMMIREGRIVAAKGLGGFHLMVDAANSEAVQRLRERKHREEKPFALMFPDLDSVQQCCELSNYEERLMLSPQCPIVLLRKKNSSSLAAAVAPANPWYGAMLPYTPLHHILLRQLKIPVVATSGNLSDEPICIDENEALQRLTAIADFFLIHNRPIVRPVDDSIVKIILSRELLLRRSRGYAPLPIPVQLEDSAGKQMLAVGGHLKNTIAIHRGRNICVSQHIGDLETYQAFETFQKTIDGFKDLFHLKPDWILCDMHPEYLSTTYARRSGIPVVSIQHHYAHIASCMAENELQGSVLGVSWDGTGYGLDGTIWGGEFLETTETSFQRVASFRLFSLPGSMAAIKEPRRTALGVLYEIMGKKLFERFDLQPLNAFDKPELNVMMQVLDRRLNSPQTSSVGRLFDAVASLAGLRQISTYEGQAAMELEFATEGNETEQSYSFKISEGDPCRIDWEPIVCEILEDFEYGVSTGLIASKFHNALVEVIMKVADRVGQERVVLSGGCFQNRYLIERVVEKLRAQGFRPYWHQRIPPNDGGLAAGQLYAALRAIPRS